MSLKQKFVSMFLNEPEKTFREVGITDSTGYLTSEGAEIFLTWLLKANGSAFKTEVVDSLVEKADKK